MRGTGLLLLTLSACRFGFSDVTPSVDGGVPADAEVPTPGMARVTVLGEEGESTAGQPIAGAYVIVIEPSGATTSTQTPASGTVSVPIAGSSEIHIARPAPELGATHWQVYSFTHLNGDLDLLVGGRAVPVATTATMTANLPAFTDMGITGSRVRGPAQCVDSEQAPSVGTTATFTFATICAGTTVPLYAQGLGLGDPWAWLPLGDVTLASGGMTTATSAWLDNEKYAIQYDGLPASIANLWGVFALPGATAADAIAIDGDDSAVVAGSGQVVLDGPPVVAGSMFATWFDDGNNASGRLTIEHIDQPFGNRHFDLALLGPSVTVPTVSGGRVQWTSDNLAGADVVAVQAKITLGGAEVTWNAYGPGSLTELTYPTLPASLAMLNLSASALWAIPAVEIVTLPDDSYGSALPIIDRDLYWWRELGTYLPAGTVSIAVAQQPTTGRTARPPIVERALRADRR